MEDRSLILKYLLHIQLKLVDPDSRQIRVAVKVQYAAFARNGLANEWCDLSFKKCPVSPAVKLSPCASKRRTGEWRYSSTHS